MISLQAINNPVLKEILVIFTRVNFVHYEMAVSSFDKLSYFQCSSPVCLLTVLSCFSKVELLFLRSQLIPTACGSSTWLLNNHAQEFVT
ncbi:hypothetical protein L3X38_025781 [Prunus dulcis]|uniref:Uncharacterized protein n=1 Tax=Prunus dulcis TaxID=3755 RepID=A0AAD4Z8B6_PRUDU|nr:hypothetical protein L3X38_025781 [Prunus dulcis]